MEESESSHAINKKKIEQAKIGEEDSQKNKNYIEKESFIFDSQNSSPQKSPRKRTIGILRSEGHKISPDLKGDLKKLVQVALVHIKRNKKRKLKNFRIFLMDKMKMKQMIWNYMNLEKKITN